MYITFYQELGKLPSCDASSPSSQCQCQVSFSGKNQNITAYFLEEWTSSEWTDCVFNFETPNVKSPVYNQPRIKGLSSKPCTSVNQQTNAYIFPPKTNKSPLKRIDGWKTFKDFSTKWFLFFEKTTWNSLGGWVPPSYLWSMRKSIHRGIQLLECPFFTQHGDVTNDGRNALHVAAQAGQGHINYFWGEIAGDLFFFL